MNIAETENMAKTLEAVEAVDLRLKHAADVIIEKYVMQGLRESNEALYYEIRDQIIGLIEYTHIHDEEV